MTTAQNSPFKACRHVTITLLLIGACASAFAGMGSHTAHRESGAACHGPDARGHGLIAPYLKAAFPDLTLITVRASGAYPTERVFRITHAQSEEFTERRHMPSWGDEFFGQKADDRAAPEHSIQRVNRLVAFLRFVQCTRDCGELP